jgi:hypothetical protein
MKAFRSRCWLNLPRTCSLVSTEDIVSRRRWRADGFSARGWSSRFGRCRVRISFRGTLSGALGPVDELLELSGVGRPSVSYKEQTLSEPDHHEAGEAFLPEQEAGPAGEPTPIAPQASATEPWTTSSVGLVACQRARGDGARTPARRQQMRTTAAAGWCASSRQACGRRTCRSG